MEIIGEHHGELTEDNLKCLLKIKSGILGIYKYGETPFNKLNKPKNEKQWNFRKVNWKESKPVKVTKMSEKGMEWVWKYSHVIEYITDNNETQRIFINPSNWEVNKIKWNNRTLFWQRITLYESIVAGLIVLLLQIIGTAVYDSFINSYTNIEPKKTIIQKTQNCQQITAPIIDTTISDTADLNRHQKDSLRHGIIH